MARSLLLAGCAGCYTYAAPVTGKPPVIEASMRLRSSVPFLVHRPTADGLPGADCHASALEGKLRRSAGDTLHLQLFGRITPAPGPDGVERACPTRGDVAVVRSPTVEVTVARVDARRTLLSIALVVVVFLAFGAYAASQIEFTD